MGELEALRLRVAQLEALEVNYRHITMALQRSEERYRLLFDSIPIPVWVYDLETLAFLAVNAAAVRNYGYSREEFLALTIKEIRPPEDIPILMEDLTKNRHQLQRIDTRRHRKKDGTIIDVEISSYEFLFEGSVSRLVLAYDITARKQAEEALRKSEQRYRDLFENASDIIYSHDLTGNCLTVNKKACEVLNYSQDELLKMNIAQLIGLSDLALIQQRVQRRLMGEELPPLELEIAAKDGRCFTVETNSWLEWEGDKPIAVYGVARDITERKRAENAVKELNEELENRVRERTAQLATATEALIAEKERLSVTLGSIGEGVIATDAQGCISLMNNVSERLIGWTQAEAVGNTFSKVFRVIDEESRSDCEDLAQKVIQAGEVRFDNAILISRNNIERIISVNGAPIYEKGGTIIGAVLVFQDVTEQRKLQEEMLKASKLESIGILAGGIAHDFNNILTAIICNLSLAKMTLPAEDKLSQRLSEIEKATLQAKNLAQQLLTFAKGGLPIIKVVSIAQLLRETATFVLRGSPIRCRLSIPDDLWLAEIDAGQIYQVISNLIINAQQAMPQGGEIEIAAENINVEKIPTLPLKPTRYLRISIKDSGIGILKEHLSKIFDPYFTTKQQGSGLGLTTAYSIVKKHNGHLTVESQVGVGTTFYIYLPASEKRLPVKSVAPQRTHTERGKILVMDDQEVIRELVREMLIRADYQVEVAMDGAQAIELCRQALVAGEPFNLAILDLTIPGGMGGKDVIHILRTLDPSLKAIVSSGYSTDPIMSDFKQYGFQGVIAKPYRVEDLLQVLEDLLECDG
ncbi:MAG: PAS domain S-box protein [Acidobacteriota bacterium]